MNQAVAVPNHADQDRSALARMVTRAFELWGLGSEDQLAMLGLSIGNRTALSRYRKGQPLAASRDLLDRAGHLLAIHKNLRLIFRRTETWLTPG